MKGLTEDGKRTRTLIIMLNPEQWFVPVRTTALRHQPQFDLFVNLRL